MTVYTVKMIKKIVARMFWFARKHTVLSCSNTTRIL